MYDDVLIPTDGSSGTSEAMAHGLQIAADNDARVHALYVIDSRHYRAASAETTEEIKRSLEEEGEVALDDAEVRIADEGLEAVVERREGVPYKEIPQYVEEAGVDLIVMGTHGKTGRDRMATLGSTTERVVKDAPVPVLVVDIG